MDQFDEFAARGLGILATLGVAFTLGRAFLAYHRRITMEALDRVQQLEERHDVLEFQVDHWKERALIAEAELRRVDTDEHRWGRLIPPSSTESG